MVTSQATIGRSQGGLEALRDPQTLQASSSNEAAEEAAEEAQGDGNTSASDEESDVEDVEDIDNETAMNTMYNLLSELGDLNRNNRRAAEMLAERFSVLQTQVSRAESLASERSLRRSNVSSSQSSTMNNSGNQESSIPTNHREVQQQTPVSVSSFSESAFHTPPTMPATIDNNSNNSRVGSPTVADAKASIEAETQTDTTGSDISELGDRVTQLEAENSALRNDVRLLIGSVREQQVMAKEYETTLAKALRALRTAAFERHQEISDVQNRYKELLFTEKSLNERLQTENTDLKHALSNAAEVIRSTLAADSEDLGAAEDVAESD
ncbi:hypothetical protein GQ54DRAFT_295604, partial [Martensiomyces pterosporus]